MSDETDQTTFSEPQPANQWVRLSDVVRSIHAAISRGDAAIRRGENTKPMLVTNFDLDLAVLVRVQQTTDSEPETERSDGVEEVYVMLPGQPPEVREAPDHQANVKSNVDPAQLSRIKLTLRPHVAAFDDVP